MGRQERTFVGDFEVKRGSPDVLSKLIETSNRVFRENRPEGSGMHMEFPHIFSRDNIKDTYFIERDGIPVSQASVFKWKCMINGSQISVASLGAVSTMAEYRKNGLASAIIRRIIHDIREENTSLMLVSGDLEIYKDLGCTESGLVYRTTWEKGKGQITGFRVKKVERNDRLRKAKKYHDLYEREPFRYVRNPKLMKVLLDAVWFRTPFHSTELFEITLDDVQIAYVVATHRNGDNKCEIVEYAGMREAVFCSLETICKHFDVKSVALKINPSDTGLKALCKSAGMRLHAEPSQGTIRIINPELLFLQLNTWFIENIGEEVTIKSVDDGSWSISIGKHTRDLKGIEALNGFVFGKAEGSLGVPLMLTDDLSFI